MRCLSSDFGVSPAGSYWGVHTNRRPDSPQNRCAPLWQLGTQASPDGITQCGGEQVNKSNARRGSSLNPNTPRWNRSVRGAGGRADLCVPPPQYEARPPAPRAAAKDSANRQARANKTTKNDAHRSGHFSKQTTTASNLRHGPQFLRRRRRQTKKFQVRRDLFKQHVRANLHAAAARLSGE